MPVALCVWVLECAGRASGVWGYSCIDGRPVRRRGDASMVVLRGQTKGAATAMKNSHCERCARGWWCRW
jgi:hypothetical protein